MKKEIWLPVKGYVGLYEVSNFGRVRSVYGETKVLRQRKSKYGYLRVNLSKKGKLKTYPVHRIVAEAFLPNLFDYTEVNHKDEDKTNNFCGTPENDFNDGNLEWCDRKYNINYGHRNEKVSKKVIQYTKTLEFVREWPSTMECGRNGFNQQHVSSCCNGKEKTHKGYIWRYKEVS